MGKDTVETQEVISKDHVDDEAFKLHLCRDREHYSPIEVIKSVSLGLKDIVLSSDEIWLCLSCQACMGICPAGIKFQDFMNVLRRILGGEGVTHYI
ncbi:MAG: hypothetical protein N3F10_07330 [Candidatus Bathyarchaeota archaeon]|nr:hypothetical protein [Candidatus Bathyarchaeota archaeon]